MKKSLKIAVPVLVVVLALLLSSACFVVTQPNEYTIVRQFGAVKKIVDEPGLSMKLPFIQTASTLPKTEMLYDLAVSDVITSDKKSMVADSFVLWRISDSMRQEEVISGRDGLLAQRIMDNVGSAFDNYGIKLLAIETKRIDLPDENKSAVYERMISERDNIAASYAAEGAAEAKQIRNEADKSVQITLSEAKAMAEKLKAEGEAEYMRILSEVYDTPEEADFYEFMRALDMAEKTLSTGNKTLVVSADSPIAKIFQAVGTGE